MAIDMANLPPEVSSNEVPDWILKRIATYPDPMKAGQVAKCLDVAITNVYEWISPVLKSGQINPNILPHFSLGPRIKKITHKDLIEWLRRQHIEYGGSQHNESE